MKKLAEKGRSRAKLHQIRQRINNNKIQNSSKTCVLSFKNIKERHKTTRLQIYKDKEFLLEQ